SRAFTVDRSPALFAVQTSRLLLVYERYRDLVPNARTLPAVEAVAAASIALAGHEEVIDRGGIPGWIDAGAVFLRWPRGGKFPYDGVNVPFNHQNEWALGV